MDPVIPIDTAGASGEVFQIRLKPTSDDELSYNTYGGALPWDLQPVSRLVAAGARFDGLYRRYWPGAGPGAAKATPSGLRPSLVATWPAPGPVPGGVGVSISVERLMRYAREREQRQLASVGDPGYVESLSFCTFFLFFSSPPPPPRLSFTVTVFMSLLFLFRVS